MFDSLFYKLFALFLIVSLAALRHTVSSEPDVIAPHEEINSKITVVKAQNSDEDFQNSNHSKSETLPAAKPVSSETELNASNNMSIISKDPFFNSTATLPKWMLSIKEGALQRTGYVALGFMSIVMIFFVVRAVRLRQKRNKSRKYGLITSNVSDMEMEPLDRDDDEEEDATIFDAQHKYSLQ